jgi:hypothetical protein
MSNSDLAFLGQGAKIDPFAYIQARPGKPVPPKPVEPPKPTPIPPAPVGPTEPTKLTPAEKKAAIEKLKKYISVARKRLMREKAKGTKADPRRLAKYRQEISRAQTRIKNIRKNGY